MVVKHRFNGSTVQPTLLEPRGKMELAEFHVQMEYRKDWLIRAVIILIRTIFLDSESCTGNLNKNHHVLLVQIK